MSDRSGTPDSHREVHTGWLRRELLMVSKPVGVWTAWCVSVGTQDDPEDATWQDQSSELRGCIVVVIAMVETNH